MNSFGLGSMGAMTFSPSAAVGSSSKAASAQPPALGTDSRSYSIRREISSSCSGLALTTQLPNSSSSSLPKLTSNRRSMEARFSSVFVPEAHSGTPPLPGSPASLDRAMCSSAFNTSTYGVLPPCPSLGSSGSFARRSGAIAHVSSMQSSMSQERRVHMLSDPNDRSDSLAAILSQPAISQTSHPLQREERSLADERTPEKAPQGLAARIIKQGAQMLRLPVRSSGRATPSSGSTRESQAVSPQPKQLPAQPPLSGSAKSFNKRRSLDMPLFSPFTLPHGGTADPWVGQVEPDAEKGSMLQPMSAAAPPAPRFVRMMHEVFVSDPGMHGLQTPFTAAGPVASAASDSPSLSAGGDAGGITPGDSHAAANANSPISPPSSNGPLTPRSAFAAAMEHARAVQAAAAAASGCDVPLGPVSPRGYATRTGHAGSLGAASTRRASLSGTKSQPTMGCLSADPPSAAAAAAPVYQFAPMSPRFAHGSSAHLQRLPSPRATHGSHTRQVMFSERGMDPLTSPRSLSGTPITIEATASAPGLTPATSNTASTMPGTLLRQHGPLSPVSTPLAHSVQYSGPNRHSTNTVPQLPSSSRSKLHVTSYAEPIPAFVDKMDAGMAAVGIHVSSADDIEEAMGSCYSHSGTVCGTGEVTAGMYAPDANLYGDADLREVEEDLVLPSEHRGTWPGFQT